MTALDPLTLQDPASNQAIVATIQSVVAAPQNLEADSVGLQVQTTAPGGDPVTYSATNLPFGLSIDASSGLISGDPAPADSTAGDDGAGNYAVTINVVDGDNVGTETLTWCVAPRISVQVTDSEQNPAAAPTNLEGDSVNLQAQASTPDNTTLTYSATNLPSGLSMSASGAVTGSISPGASTSGDDGVDGSYTTIVTVTDGTYATNVTLGWTVAPAFTVQIPTVPSSIEGDTGTIPGNYSVRSLQPGVDRAR